MSLDFNTETLINLIAKLPGLCPRSARKIAIHLIRQKDAITTPLVKSLDEIIREVSTCKVCGNIGRKAKLNNEECPLGNKICIDPKRDKTIVCVVEDIEDFWAIEKSNFYKGLYHILGGVISAVDGIRPEHLNIEALLNRIKKGNIKEVILALGATVEGQTTSHSIVESLSELNVEITQLARGIPVGGELHYLDDGTLAAAFKDRR